MTDFISTQAIWVKRDARQRKTIDVSDLLSSIATHGILQPVIVKLESGTWGDEDHPETRPYKLIAGERRWTTACELGMEEIPVRFFDHMSEIEQQLIEFEENIRRKDLTWQETASAILGIHRLHILDDAEWDLDKTATSVKLSKRSVENYLKLAVCIEAEDQSIIASDTMSGALTIHTRRAARAQDAELARLTENRQEKPANAKPQAGPVVGSRVEPPLEKDGVAAPGAGQPRQVPGPTGDRTPDEGEPRLPASDPQRPPARIDCLDAIEFFDTYDGPRFNFLHCDFPYGVVLHGQANQESFEGGGYESNPEIYWALMAALERSMAKGNVMLPSAHVMFWISMKFYSETIELLEAMGWNMNPVPLVWHKTDNRGILPDAKRGPRQTYEAALIGSIGDRFIVKPVANSYGAPTDKGDSIHTNEKPQPMLNHFLSMFVDEHSRVLDPTCGSGSAVRAAENLGAEFALGLEFNEDFAGRAEARLRSARTLRTLSAKA